MSLKTKKILYLLVKIIFALAIYYYLYTIFLERYDDVKLYLKNFRADSSFLLLFLLCCLLMLLNYYIEAKKWQISVSHLQNVNIFLSIKAVFCALPFAVFSPNRIGESLVRPLFLSKENRLKAIICSSYNGFMQMPIMLLFSGFSSILLKVNQENSFINHFAFYGTVILISLLMIIFVFVFEKIFPNIENRGKILKNFAVLKQFTNVQKKNLLLLSIFRYLVYSTQSVILYYAFGMQINIIDIYIIVFISYMLMSFVPRPAIAEFGVRTSFSLLVASSYTSNYEAIFLASFAIWMINLFVPSIISLIINLKFVKNYHIIKKNI